MSETLMLPKEAAEKMIWMNVGDILHFDGEQYALVDLVANGSGRWNEYWQLIFQALGSSSELFACDYELGLTEAQDNPPFEMYDDEIPCYSVERVEKVITTITYVKVK